jgi:alkyl sulfatase BDS1-like metallo-beta-lactamase superfamily hydrolase
MEAALEAVRKETSAPVVACFYYHFHYVGGTKALTREIGGEELPIYGHSGIADNIARFGGEIAPRVSRGLVHQFGLMLPEDGEDGLVHVGLGRFFRNPRHAPYTPGYIPPDITFDHRIKFEVAGLDVEFIPAPSDATDSLTIWFPGLKVAINNLLWPALFNIFAIRGEEYRDPRLLLEGLDDLKELGSKHLIGAHGPPLSGDDLIEGTIEQYRDSIQFIWDQTVRGANLGLTLDELVKFVTLPDLYLETYFTQQLYGVVEHHVRQIYFGLFGWFDEDESRLLPLPAPDRAQKLISGFGGKDAVRGAIDVAMAEMDFRWALELSSWLVRSDVDSKGRADAGEPEDRKRLAGSLRAIGYSTTSSNLRNWCLTRALELDGSIDLSRFREHRFRSDAVFSDSPERSISMLRVLLVPERAVGYEGALTLIIKDEGKAGLKIRNQVAVPFPGDNKDLITTLSKRNWADLIGGKTDLYRLVSEEKIECFPDYKSVQRFFSCFDHPGLNQPEERDLID